MSEKKLGGGDRTVDTRRLADDLKGQSLADVYESNSTGAERTGLGRRRFLAGAATAVGAGTLLTGQSAAQRVIPDSPDQVATASGSEGMVSSSQPLATEAGADVLEAGGNAIDAAAAVQFALSVVEPHATGIGGGGFMLVHSADENETHLVNGQIRAPASAEPGRFDDVDGEPSQSGLAVGTPGTPRTLQTALDRWGTLPLSEVVHPAADLAGNGFEIDGELARAINNNYGRMTSATQEIFGDDDGPLSQGDTLVQSAFAETLEIIAEEGIGAFYEGPIADDIAATVQAEGGDLTVDDLAGYETTLDEPIESEFAGCRTVAGSGPSSGLTLLQLLRIIDQFDLSRCEPGSAELYNLIVEASNLAYADRSPNLGDPEFVDIPTDELLSDEYLDARRDLITIGEANPDIGPGQPTEFEPENGEAGPMMMEEEEQTTHFTVADGEGNVVSYTSTLSLFFGSGISVPERGIVLANSMTLFSDAPDAPNAIEPNKRPVSTMSPAMVFQNGDPLMTVGSPGGAVIIGASAQVAMYVLGYHWTLEEAIAEPRVFSGAYPSVEWEEGVSEEARSELSDYGYEVDDTSTDIGNVQSIFVEQDGFLGAADPRRSGDAIGLPR
jgi:gamma-glutamyltranspeptidase / glutathione hydrolase